MAAKKYFISGVFIIFAVLLFFPNNSSAVIYNTECGEEMTIGAGYPKCCAAKKGGGCALSCTNYSCYGSWDEYKIESAGCGADILVRHAQSVCGPGFACCGCGPCQVQYSEPEIYKKVGSWQKAAREGQGACAATNWGLDAPKLKCTSECIKAPENPRYYDNPNYPTDACKPEAGESSKNISLPVKLDWDDVEGWKGGWCKKDGQCSEECVQSYKINLKGIDEKKVANQSEFIPESCKIPSNTTQNWSTQACCGVDGKACGPESKDWNFATNLAPEPVAPLDPDWVGTKKGENIASPVTLDWCDVKEAQSYRFKVYIIEGGNKVCHPDLLSTSEGKEVCDSWLLRKTRRDSEQEEKALYSDFFDENMDFFTKNTVYAWQTTICDENGFDCKDESQLWMFSAKDVPLATSFLVSPTNDPDGKTPVGLPMILDWNDKPGVNSFIYEVTAASDGQKISGSTNVSQSKSFDYPELSLNTLYQWKVKSCWDYEAKKCEPNFSEEWSFKTTGQAPKLIYPASSEQNVVIPINFTWEGVPGARSYILKIDGLLEKTLDKPEFSLDFPDYPIHQETNYSWQVKTCAWDNGKTCGAYSSPQSLKTFRLPPPQKPSPGDNGQFFTDDRYLAWEAVPGAKAYQYKMTYLSLAEKEIDQTCASSVGQEAVPQKTVGAQNDYISLLCLGEYQWQTRSCLDKDCQEISNWSDNWSFTLLEGGSGQNGLVPCGRNADDPKTSWNEREPCQIKHLFLSVKIIIDFLLFRAAPLILVLLTILTGLIFYTSLGQMMTMARVIGLWKAAGIGLGIIFFAWTIVNIFLRMIGYNIGIFGNWYQIL